MSKHHLRHEKNCLNCGTIVQERYCSHCGQENLEIKETIGHLLIHFFNDVTHFDGKLFSTLKVLFTKPGFLSVEYMHGRRASYLNPIRMFLLISFSLFLIQFAIADKNSKETSSIAIFPPNNFDSTIVNQSSLDSISNLKKTSKDLTIRFDSANWYNKIVYQYETVHKYDSIQQVLPVSMQDGWTKRFINRRALGFEEYSTTHKESLTEDILKVLFHSLPKALFLSVPLIAFILWLLYIRRRKTYYFVSHTIFVVHLYCAIYLLMLLIALVGIMDFKSTEILQVILFCIIPIYLFLAMMRFYKQSWFKTFFKYILLLVSSGFVFIVLLVGLLLNALLILSAGGH